MNIDDIQLLYDYNYWATQQVLAACQNLSHEQFIAPAAHSFGSLRSTLVHGLDAEWGWRVLCQDQNLTAFHELRAEDFPTVAAVAERWQAEEQAMRGYLNQLTNEDLADYVRYTTPEGEKRERVLWHCLWHVVNHGTQHRSEAAAIVSSYGYSPGEIDFTVFLNGRQ